MEERISDAVGNMIEIFGLVLRLRLRLWVGAVVDRVGMRVEWSHFSPTEAMDET